MMSSNCLLNDPCILVLSTVPSSPFQAEMIFVVVKYFLMFIFKHVFLQLLLILSLALGAIFGLIAPVIWCFYRVHFTTKQKSNVQEVGLEVSPGWQLDTHVPGHNEPHSNAIYVYKARSLYVSGSWGTERWSDPNLTCAEPLQLPLKSVGVQQAHLLPE